MTTTRLWLAPAALAVVALAAPAAAEEDPRRFLGMIQSYLDVMDRMGRISEDPRLCLLMAQNSIKDLYDQKGQRAEAAVELRKILEGVEDPAARTALRFTLADIYKETGQREKALEELRAVVAESKARLAKAPHR